MQSLTSRSRRAEHGQGMAEYIVLVALVTITVIGVVTIFGDGIRGLFSEPSSPPLTTDVGGSAKKMGAPGKR